MLQKNLSSNSIMPLMMNFTKPSPIMESEGDPVIVYNDFAQIVELNLLTIGTKCLKSFSTAPKKGCGGYICDKKNDIDDSKTKK